MTRYDLIVLGGGPAGSSTAIAAARQGLAVILLDRARPPIRKVCGEVISLAGYELATELTGIDWSGSPRLERARFMDARRPDESVEWRLACPSFGISRTRLDGELLAAAIRAGVRVERGARVRRWDRTPTGDLCVTMGSDDSIMAPRLVLATGRRPAAGPNGWIGWRDAETVPAMASRPELEVVLGESEHYYGRATIDDGTVTTTHLARAAEFHHSVPPGCVGTPRFELGLSRIEPEPAVFPVGDAMAAWPPIVGDGITAALAAGSRLGTRLAGGTFDEASWRHDWNRHHGRALASALALHSILLRPSLRRPLWRLARAFSGLAPFLEARVRLPSASPRGGRDATRDRCIPAGS